MSEKFNISEKDELTILLYWINTINYAKVPNELKKKITEQQTADLYTHYLNQGDLEKVIDTRIKELENKFKEQKEQSFRYILIKEVKEQTARLVVSGFFVILGLILGILVSNLYC